MQACHNFFVKKPKIFENVKSERAAANFQKSRALHVSTIISKNSQIYGIKNMFAGSIITIINHYNEHDTTLFLSYFNESEVN